jgi:predicted nucleic acid-binding protein
MVSKLEIPRIYLESSSINDLAIGEAKQTSDKDVERDVWMVREALRLAREEKLLVYTSTISIAECLGTDPNSPKIPEKLMRFLDSLLLSGKSGIKLVQTTQTVCTQARDIRWVTGIGGVKGNDGIHVATARFMKCGELWTRDETHILSKKDKFAELGLRVNFPRDSRLMPAQMPLGINA